MGKPANEQENFYTCLACARRWMRASRGKSCGTSARHEPLEIDEETRKQDGSRLGVLSGLIIVVAILVYVTGIGY
jgi:hypothetical protein